MKYTALTALLLTVASVFAAPIETMTQLKTHEWQTQNGAHVVFYPAPDVPMLDINIAFAAGSAYDGTQWGLSALTAQLLDQGNGGLNADAFAKQLAEVGAQYGGANTQDMLALKLRTLTQPDALKQATDMFALLISHPDFPTEAFLREQNQQLMEIKHNEESASTVADERFYRALYGDHPYAHPITGTHSTVTALTVQDVRRFYQHYIVSQNATIVLVGAIDDALAHQLAERITRDLPKGQPAPALPTASPLTQAISLNIKHPAKQTALRVGQLGITHHTRDYFALQVGNYILGGGGSMRSRLGDALREQRGLTYDVSSTFSSMPGVGPFVIALSTRDDQTKTALNVIHSTLTDFIKTGPTEPELIAAKRYLTGSFPVSLASNQNIGALLLRLAFYHLPQDFLNTYVEQINAITVADIKRAFQQHIHPETQLHVTVGHS